MYFYVDGYETVKLLKIQRLRPVIAADSSSCDVCNHVSVKQGISEEGELCAQ